MRASSPFIASVALTLASTTFALPNVSIQPLPTDCSSYPAYDATTKSAGPWAVAADSTGESSVDGLKVSIESFTNNGTDRYGFITLPKQGPYRGATPNITLRCTSPSTLQAQLRTDWVNISIASQENWQSSISFGMPDAGTSIQPYAHTVNGTRVPGVFLGAKNSTTWKYKYNWGGNAGEYYILRWLEQVSGLAKRQSGFPVLDDRDWVGFLRVVG